MNEQPISVFPEAIQATHGCRSSLRERVEVREEFEGETVWEGMILSFDLIGHPTASICYAWSVGRRVTAVLHEGPVDSPETAVRAAILTEEQMPEPELIEGCPVLEDGRSADPRFPSVALCKLPEPEGGFKGANRYVVWDVDQHRAASGGSYQEIYDAALAEFERRTI